MLCSTMMSVTALNENASRHDGYLKIKLLSRQGICSDYSSQVSTSKHTPPLMSAQPPSMFTTLKLHRINRARRHLLLILCTQFSKRHIFLGHHRSSILVVREVRTSTDDSTFLLQVTSARSALLLSFHQQQCHSENRSKSEEAARDADTCLSSGAEMPCLVVVVARRRWGRVGAGARLRR